MIPVRTGQIFVEAGARAALWEVVQVIAPRSGLMHARLRERNGRRRMLLSCRQLVERFRLYVMPVPAAPVRPDALPIAAIGAAVPRPYVHQDDARREVA